MGTGCAGGGALTLQRSETLHSRPPAGEESRVGLGFFSHEGIGAQHNHQHADDFTLDAPSRITGLRWWGLVDGAGGGESLTNISAFAVTLFESTPAGEPGRVLHHERVPLAATDPLPTGRRGAGVAPAASTAQEFAHEVRLSSPVNLAAGVTYWLSVQATRIDPAGDNWQWQDGALHNGVSYSRTLAPPDGDLGAWTRIDDTDIAFEIRGWRQEIDPAFDSIRQ